MPRQRKGLIPYDQAQGIDAGSGERRDEPVADSRIAPREQARRIGCSEGSEGARARCRPDRGNGCGIDREEVLPEGEAQARASVVASFDGSQGRYGYRRIASETGLGEWIVRKIIEL